MAKALAKTGSVLKFKLGRCMRASDFDYSLPPELIAQIPAPQRDQSRLLVLDRVKGQITHRDFSDLPEYFSPGDLLVLNDSRVIPARLRALNMRTHGQFEVLLLEEIAINDWWAMMRPGKRAGRGTRMQILGRDTHPSAFAATVLEMNAEGYRRLQIVRIENANPSGPGRNSNSIKAFNRQG